KIAGARRKGKWTGGPVPLGYTVVDKRLVVEELEAVLVREIFALYLEHRSALGVARLLKDRQRSTKRHRAANGNLREGRTWTKGDVLRILKNPIYAGYMASGGELHKAEHAPLIEMDTFTRAQAQLEGATKTTATHGRNPEYILRSVLRCACCGSGFTPASTRKARTEHRYYRCMKRDKEGKEACPSSPLPADAIESYVVERLREATADGTLATEVAESVKARVAERRKGLVTERQKLPVEIASLSAEARRTVDTMAGMTGTARQLVDERLQQIGDQLGRCEGQLAAAERALANLDALEVEVDWVARCLTDFDGIWDVLTPENRGRLLRAVVQRVEVNEPANEVSVFLADLGAEVPAEAAPKPAQQEVSP
ncbi:MAG: recombinase family protein, partial [Deltaproteobacteria bacterium]